jgi:raffinose/stachyose/melibiose transport system permease protein
MSEPRADTVAARLIAGLGRGGAYLLLGVVALQTLYPLLWVVFGSLKTNEEMIINVWGPPAVPQFSNYVQAWQIAGMGTRILNSLELTACTLALVVVAAAPCAYALARMRFPGQNVLFGVIVASMLVPAQITAIPLFLVARDLGLINSVPGASLIMAATGIPVSVFVLRGFFKGLPAELEDAALVDGAGRLTILWRIIQPLARPGIALVLILQFIDVWNDFFLSMLLLRRPEVQTIPLGLVNFFQQYESMWSFYFAALAMTMLPVILVFVVLQRQFIAGLTAGAVKG